MKRAGNVCLGDGNHQSEPREFLKQLWDQLNSNEDLAPQLESIINDDQRLESWREALIHCPEAFSYCEKNYIRKDTSNTIYLLRRSQLNGYHAELFTYCLYIKLKKLKDIFTILKPFYCEVTDTYSEPCLRLSGNFRGKKVTFSVFSENGAIGFKSQRLTALKLRALKIH